MRPGCEPVPVPLRLYFAMQLDFTWVNPLYFISIQYSAVPHAGVIDQIGRNGFSGTFPCYV